MIPCFVFIIIGIVTISYFSNSDASLFFESLYSKTSLEMLEDQSMQIISKILTTLLSISSLVPLVMIINIIFTSKKRSINDHFSNTVVIKMIDVNSDEPSKKGNYKQDKNVNIKYGLPGEIIPEAIETIED